MAIAKGRMWAFCIGRDDRTMGCDPMVRQRSQFDSTLVACGFTGAYDLSTWSQEDRAAYLAGYNGK